MNKLKFILRYIKFWLTAKTKYSIHSPFVYYLMDEVLNPNKQYYAFKNIEGVRQMLLKNSDEIKITDFGAGSLINDSRKRKISDIAKNTAKPAFLGRILFKLVNFVRPQTMLELGTSLGISSLYQQSAASKSARFITMEGCPQTAGVAKRVFQSYQADNVEIVEGNFDETLAPTIASVEKLDYAFFDGNHQKDPTVDYFTQALKKAHENSLFIFDDIHWSEEMEEAWEIIKKDPNVTLTIDFFWIGLVFFKKGREKEHFKIRL